MKNYSDPREYCNKCGSQLIVKREWKTGAFSRDSGREYTKRKIGCPNKRWWFDNHLEYIDSDNPDDRFRE